MQFALCARMGNLRVSSKAPVAQTLSSKQNGIAGVAPRLCTTALATQRRATAAVVEVECADGRRGGKLKTRKAAAKRFNVTGSGKVTIRRAGKNHFQEKKSSKRRNKLSMKQQASDSMLDNIKGCLPYSKVKGGK